MKVFKEEVWSIAVDCYGVVEQCATGSSVDVLLEAEKCQMSLAVRKGPVSIAQNE